MATDPIVETVIGLLYNRPPRISITDQRYWDWDRQVEEALAQYEAATNCTRGDTD